MEVVLQLQVTRMRYACLQLDQIRLRRDLHGGCGRTPILETYRASIENLDEIRDYQHEVHKIDFERSEMNKDKTGVETRTTGD